MTVIEIQVLGPSGTLSSAISLVSGTTDQWQVTITWTPTAAQIGQNIICAKANDNVMLSSDLHCFTLLAGIYPPKLLGATKTPSGVLSPATLAGVSGFITWSISFDQPVLKPSKSAYIFFYQANGVLLYQIGIYKNYNFKNLTASLFFFKDVSVFPTVSFINNDTVTFLTFNNFADGSYYITFDYGVGVGSQYCQAQSDPEKSTTFWTFTVTSSTTTTPITTLAIATSPATGGAVAATGLSSTANPILPVTTTLSTLSPTATTTVTTTTVTTTAIGTTTINNGATTTAVIGTTTTNSVTATTSTASSTVSTTASATVAKKTTEEVPASECSMKGFVSTMALNFAAFLLIHCATMLIFFYKFLT